jgi:hypothetical protein
MTAAQVNTNRRKRRLVGRQRRCVRRSMFFVFYSMDIFNIFLSSYFVWFVFLFEGLPVHVQLPLAEEFVATLKGMTLFYVPSVFVSIYLRQANLLSFRRAAALPGRSYYGPPHHTCISCGAFFWFQERCKRTSTRHQVIYSV